MASYKVLDSKVARELPPKGDFAASNVVHITLADNGTEALGTLFQKTTTPLPEVGSMLEGEWGEQDRFDTDRRKFKKARQGGGGFAKSPEEKARIEWMNCRTAALNYIQAKAVLGKIEDFSMADVTQLALAFKRDLDTQGATPSSDTPFDDTGLPPAA